MLPELPKTEKSAMTQELPKAIDSAKATELMVQQMQEVLTQTTKPMDIPERDIAAFIVALHKKKGTEAVDNFIERATGGQEFKFLPFEKEIFKQTVISMQPRVNTISRRRFHAVLGEIGAGIGLTVLLGGSAAAEALQKTAEPIIDENRKQEVRRQGHELVKFVRDNPHPPETTTLKQVDEFYAEVDKRVGNMLETARPESQPKPPPSWSKAIGIVAIVGGAIYSEHARRHAKTDLKEVYQDSARYIAHKAAIATKIEADKLKPAQDVQVS
jgi:hypothetical protein